MIRLRGFLGVITIILAAVSASAAPLVDQSSNLLANGSFESGSFDPVTGHAVASAASNWYQWSNSGGSVTTELITESEMLSMTGVGLRDGNAALMITTTGAGDGGFSFETWGHPGWDVNGDVTFSGWVYVLSGQMSFMVGANSPGYFEVAETTTTGQWEFVSVSKAGGADATGLNNEPLLYSINGPATFVVDSIWLNQGLQATHPDQVAVPEPGGIWIFLMGVVVLGVGLARRRRQGEVTRQSRPGR